MRHANGDDMATIEGIHQHAKTGRRYRFKATYGVDGPTGLRWEVQWWSDEDGSKQAAEGVIRDAHLIAFSHRLVIEQVVDAINAS
jgi:hypothetical protein